MKIKYYTHGEELTGFDIALKKGTTIIDTLKIPSIVEGKPIAHIATTIGEAFSKLKGKGISEIKNVLIEDGITTIAPSSFAKIDIKIDQVCWPASCTVIPDHCFYDSNIESITGTDFVTTVGKGAFGLTHVTTFEWPPLCKEIPEGCFDGSSLIEITGIDQVNNIGKLAFSETRLQTFSWPPKCKTIPPFCFCLTPLENIRCIDGVEKIEKNTFCGTKLQRFSWPSKCKTIPELCFYSSSLRKITGIDKVEAIGERAFCNTKLQLFLWPTKCDTIPKECFYNTPLESIVGVEKVKEIRDRAFSDTKLSCFNLYEPIRIKESAFCRTALKTLNIVGQGKIVNFDMSFFELWHMDELEKLERIDMSDCAGVMLVNMNELVYEKIKDKIVFPYYGVF